MEQNSEPADHAEIEEPSSSSHTFRSNDDKRKRGKYRKYSIELKREIGSYAQTHGKQSAIDHFSNSLGFTLSESTVRHFVRQCGYTSPSPPPGLVRRKARLAYSKEFRAKVGEFAVEFGNSKARDHFESSLGVRVPESTIRDMKKWFLSKHQSSSDDEPSSSKGHTKVHKRQRGRKNFKYGLEQRLVIADYALKHGNTAAVRFFARYGLELNESTVRSFKRKFLRMEANGILPEFVPHTNVSGNGEYMSRLFAQNWEEAVIPTPEVTIQRLDSSTPNWKTGSEELDLPVPDVTIERLATSSEVVNLDTGQPYEDVDDVERRKEELEYLEAQEAALRLLDLARGFRASEERKEPDEPDSVASSTVSKIDLLSTQNSSNKSFDTYLERSEHFRKRYTQDLRSEIGHYALLHGVGPACRVYSERMGRSLPRTSVRDMMIKYQTKHGLSNLPPLNPVDVKL